jgi:tellurite resistance protein TerC
MIISNELIFLLAFVVFIVFMLLLDLLVIGKNSHIIGMKEAAVWSFVWIGLALAFSIFLYFFGHWVHGVKEEAHLYEIVNKYSPGLKSKLTNDYASDLALYRKNMTIDYLSGYFMEKTLSIDNLFVMLMILNVFSVEQKAYKPVLFWGILGAIILRFVFIFVGAALVQKFDWVLLIFGAYLIYAGIKMYIDRNKEEKIDPKHHPVMKFLSKHFHVWQEYDGTKFFVRHDKILHMTPLFVVLIFIEFSDVIFATDSIPAIFSITRDPYVVFFSNIFAILGLRSLFFLLVHVVDLFHYLKTGIAFLLGFVGVKLLFHKWLEEIGFRSEYSLYVILGVLVLSIVLSVLFPKKEENQTPAPTV